MDADALRPERPVLTAAVLAVLAVAGPTFALTAAGYYGTFTTDDLSGTVTGYEVQDGEPRVVAEVRIDNGLPRPITVGSGSLRVVADGAVLTRNAGSFVDERVPADGQRTIRIGLRVQDDERDAVVAAARNGTLVVEGLYRATIEAQEIEFRVETAPEVADGG